MSLVFATMFFLVFDVLILVDDVMAGPILGLKFLDPCLVHMNVFAKFYEIPSMILQDIKETKRYGHTFRRSVGQSFGRTDNVKTVYPPTNTVCGGYKNNNDLTACFVEHLLTRSGFLSIKAKQ